MNTIGDAPIEEKYRDQMRAIVIVLHEYFNGKVPIGKAKTAFVLMVFDVGDTGRCNYIATANREDVVTLLKEQLSRFEGMPDIEGRA